MQVGRLSCPMVVGGKNAEVYGRGGNVFLDGLFAVNRWCKMADISDGTSSTFAFGESVHNSYRGGGPSYNTSEGGPCRWWAAGGECHKPSCAPVMQEYGRGYRSTMNSFNSNLCL